MTTSLFCSKRTFCRHGNSTMWSAAGCSENIILVLYCSGSDNLLTLTIIGEQATIFNACILRRGNQTILPVMLWVVKISFLPLSLSKFWIYNNIFFLVFQFQFPFILYLFYQERLKFLWATEDFLYLFIKFKTKTLWSWIKRNIIILSKSDDYYCKTFPWTDITVIYHLPSSLPDCENYGQNT